MPQGFCAESIAWDSIPVEDARIAIALMVESLATIDVAWLAANRSAPQLYSSGVRYVDAPPGVIWWFWDVPSIIRAGGANCMPLVAWRLAELRLHGYDAGPLVVQRPLGFHVLVQFPDGTTEDPSALLGG